MNILHISPYYPDIKANHAGGVCMGKEIETLAEFNNVYVLTFISQEFDKTLAEKHKNDKKWQSVKISKLTRAFHVLTEPWLPAYFAARSSLRFSIKLIHMMRRYKIDAIHAEYASMGQYLWIKKLFPGVMFNLVEHDMTAQSFERKIEALNTADAGKTAEAEKKQQSGAKKNASNGLRRKPLKDIKKAFLISQYRKVKTAEGQYCRKADKLFTFNEKDKRLIAEHYGRNDTTVLNVYCGIEDSIFDDNAEKTVNIINVGQSENTDRTDGIRHSHENSGRINISICGDTDLCRAGKAADIPEREPFSLCFLGQMGRPENDIAAKRLIDICAAVKKSLPKLRVYIVGNNPSEELINKAEKANDKAGGEKWITVTGFVDDVDIFIKKSQAAVFPLTTGAGIKVKVLRSMALGTPVITGIVGAEGIDEDGNVIISAETDDEYAEKIKLLLGESGLTDRKLGEQSRDFVREHFSWRRSEEILRGIYGK